MSMQSLVAAGAPELPDGWFYRLRETSIDSMKVEIRRRRRFGSNVIAETYVLHERFDTAIGAVVDACRRAYASVVSADDYRAKYLAATAYVGDHDPRGK